MSRLDWRRCRPILASESKYGSGVVLQNGARTPVVVGDSLAQRAERAMRSWERTLTPADRQRVRFAEPPGRYELRAPVSIGGGT
jgi:hypothetical protein